jgi:hypothetical protein
MPTPIATPVSTDPTPADSDADVATPVERLGFPVLSPPTAAGLSDLARVLAGRADTWQPLVRFEERERFYTRLAAEPGWEAWLLTWLPGQRTGLHDHGDSAGAFVVVSGVLEEFAATRTDGGTTHLRREAFTARHVRSFGRRHVHDVVNSAGVPAISLHVYAPVLTRMRRLRIDDGGRLQVVSRHRAGDDW